MDATPKHDSLRIPNSWMMFRSLNASKAMNSSNNLREISQVPVSAWPAEYSLSQSKQREIAWDCLQAHIHQ